MAMPGIFVCLDSHICFEVAPFFSPKLVFAVAVYCWTDVMLHAEEVSYQFKEKSFLKNKKVLKSVEVLWSKSKGVTVVIPVDHY